METWEVRGEKNGIGELIRFKQGLYCCPDRVGTYFLVPALFLASPGLQVDCVIQLAASGQRSGQR